MVDEKTPRGDFSSLTSPVGVMFEECLFPLPVSHSSPHVEMFWFPFWDTSDNDAPQPSYIIEDGWCQVWVLIFTGYNDKYLCTFYHQFLPLEQYKSLFAVCSSSFILTMLYVCMVLYLLYCLYYSTILLKAQSSVGKSHILVKNSWDSSQQLFINAVPNVWARLVFGHFIFLTKNKA